MPVKAGQKWACESCVRGHRVSNCNHEDRPLRLIAPKGRPVKQCEHCRTSRKSKSHHAKCDCGHRKDKKPASEPETTPLHDSGCLCHNGEACSCGSKPEPAESRHARRVSTSRPALASSISDTKLMVRTNGHHGPIHRHNNLAHTSGLPYARTKRATIHGSPTLTDDQGLVQSPNFSYAQDDMSLNTKQDASLPSYSHSEDYIVSPVLSSPLNLESSSFPPFPTNASYESLIGANWPRLTTDLIGNTTVATDFATSSSTVPAISPNFDSSDMQSANHFYPYELPLVSPMAPAFPQTYLSDDYGSGAGLTSTSSIFSEYEAHPTKTLVRNDSASTSDLRNLRSIDSYTSLNSGEIDWNSHQITSGDDINEAWSAYYVGGTA